MRASGFDHFMRNHVKGISAKQKNNFFRQMGILTGSGITILKALKMVHRSSRGNMRTLLKDAVMLIEQGNDFSRLGHFYPIFFDKMTIAMIAAGEKSGNLAEIFKEVHHNLEKKTKFKKKIIGAMMMPVFTFLFAIGVVFFMAIKVIPEFAKFLNSMGADMPALTKWVLETSNYILEHWKVILTYSGGVIVAMIVLYIVLKPLRSFLDYVIIRIPLVGSIALYGALSSFSSSMHKLIGSGVGLVESLTISKEGIMLTPMRRLLDEVKEAIIAGGNFSDPFQKKKFIPLIYSDILIAGEESGNLDEALVQLTTIYEEETNQRVAILQGMITPIMTILIGGIVGVIAASLIMGMIAVWASTGASK
jgi:type IV pilus assembly protein PilC